MPFPHFSCVCVCVCAFAWRRQLSRQMIQRFFLHNLISPIALPSQIQYTTHCCCTGFAGRHGHGGSQVSCATIKKNDSRLHSGLFFRGHVCKTKSCKYTQKKQPVTTVRSLPHRLHMLNGWLCTTSLQLTLSKGPGSPALGKVTLSCLGWFISCSELLLIWHVTLEQFALGDTTTCHCPRPHSSQGRRDTAVSWVTQTPAKNANEIEVAVKWELFKFAVYQGSSSGTGWGSCTVYPEGVKPRISGVEKELRWFGASD